MLMMNIVCICFVAVLFFELFICCGDVLVGLDQRSCSTPSSVTTWMGDCPLIGKLSQYVPDHLGQLSLPSLRVGKSSTSLTAQGTLTCVGWQVTLCDPIWQVTPRNYDIICSG